MYKRQHTHLTLIQHPSQAPSSIHQHITPLPPQLVSWTLDSTPIYKKKEKALITCSSTGCKPLHLALRPYDWFRGSHWAQREEIFTDWLFYVTSAAWWKTVLNKTSSDILIWGLSKCTMRLLQHTSLMWTSGSQHFLPPLSLSLIHIWRCRRLDACRSRWSPYH